MEPRQASRRVRWAWALLAYASAAVALVGVAVPVLPTTPFALLAVYAAARGSERFHAWLVRHPALGPVVAAWADGRSVPRRAKVAASSTMAVSAVVLLLIAPSAWLVAAVTAFMACVATWLWSRPEPAAQQTPSSRSASAAAGSRSAGSP